MSRSEEFWRAHPNDRPFHPDDAHSREWATDDEPDRGYSSFTKPHELVGYFHPGERPEGKHADSHVVRFTGKRVGTGMDGEPLAVPDMRKVERLSWAQFHDHVGRDKVADIERRNGWRR